MDALKLIAHIFDNYMEQFRQPARPLKEPLYRQEEGELNE